MQYLLISSLLGVFILAYVFPSNDPLAAPEVLSSILQVWLYMCFGNTYFWTQFHLNALMWSHHRYEFRRHAKTNIALMIVTPISIWSCSTFSWLWFLNTICQKVDNNLLESLKQSGVKDAYQDTGICEDIIAFYKDRQYGFYSDPWQATYSFFSILPFLVFLMLDKPHDCYKCVGKDPKRKYSKF